MKSLWKTVEDFKGSVTAVMGVPGGAVLRYTQPGSNLGSSVVVSMVFIPGASEAMFHNHDSDLMNKVRSERGEGEVFVLSHLTGSSKH